MDHLEECSFYETFDEELNEEELHEARELFIKALETVDGPILDREAEISQPAEAASSDMERNDHSLLRLCFCAVL